MTKTYRIIGHLQTPSTTGLKNGEVYIERDAGAWRVYQWRGFADLLCHRKGFYTMKQAEKWARIWMRGDR